MDASVGKITWGYIWRLIVWTILMSFVFGFIFNIIIATGSTINLLSSPGSMISYYKKSFIGMLIISLFVTVISCKFATSGIQKKFKIDSTNVKQVFKAIVIVLVVIAVIYIVYNIINITNTQRIIKSFSSVSNQLLEDFSGFCITFAIISVILNSLVMFLMIPFEKKLLKA